MAPSLSFRQSTLRHLLSGEGLASDDSASLKKICIALAEDAELGAIEADEQVLASAGKRLSIPARPMSS